MRVFEIRGDVLLLALTLLHEGRVSVRRLLTTKADIGHISDEAVIVPIKCSNGVKLD